MKETNLRPPAGWTTGGGESTLSSDTDSEGEGGGCWKITGS